MSALTTALPVSAQQLVHTRLDVPALIFRLCVLTRILFSKVRLSISSSRMIYQLSPKTFQKSVCAAISIAPLRGTCASNMIVSPYETEERNTLLRTPRNNLASPLSSSRPFLVALG